MKLIEEKYTEDNWRVRIYENKKGERQKIALPMQARKENGFIVETRYDEELEKKMLKKMEAL